jgi:glucosamine 6-phosphate synthetase-like amidotransferase/phosphosugar isomerase protein
MCSIVGVGFQKDHAFISKYIISKIVTELLINGMSRGRTATGLCYTSNKEMTIVKNKLQATDFTETDFYKKSLDKYVRFNGNQDQQLLSIIGHCRHKTKGTELNNKNNHPICYRNVIGVHNGVITNDDALFAKYRNTFKRNAQVDSEIIFALIDHFAVTLQSIPQGIQKACKELSGSYACAMVHRYQPHILWLFKANSPCVIYHFKEKGLILFASLSNFITDLFSSNISGFSKHVLGDYEEISLDPNEGIGIDLYRNKYQRFDLEIASYDRRR